MRDSYRDGVTINRRCSPREDWFLGGEAVNWERVCRRSSLVLRGSTVAVKEQSKRGFAAKSIGYRAGVAAERTQLLAGVTCSALLRYTDVGFTLIS